MGSVDAFSSQVLVCYDLSPLIWVAVDASSSQVLVCYDLSPLIWVVWMIPLLKS